MTEKLFANNGALVKNFMLKEFVWIFEMLPTTDNKLVGWNLATLDNSSIIITPEVKETLP